MATTIRPRIRQRARGYIEVKTAAGTTVVSKLEQAIPLLVDGMGTEADDRLRARLDAVLSSIRRGARLDSQEAGLERWYGRLAGHDLDGLHVIAWYHRCGWLGLEIIGRVSDDEAYERGNQIAKEIQPGEDRTPRNSLGLANVRPWRALPDGAEACFIVRAVVDEEATGEVTLYRWPTKTGERWLVTMAEENEVVGDHPTLEGIVAKLDKRYYWGVEVSQLGDLEWPTAGESVGGEAEKPS